MFLPFFKMSMVVLISLDSLSIIASTDLDGKKIGERRSF
jgi:hypothetical protein